ncbi:cellulose biosynthesis protein BcsC [Castellaniella defragrans]|uniref:cellulose biosynthesis protein BcsC n=1 Tax=Castellaniella defragrans TaxID=75697 RepID=UPI002AFEE92D|nr:cellulose synthase subunit BcsC-related outer membrane protein [Castellaniella defragrans]
MFRYKQIALGGLCAVLLSQPVWAEDAVQALIEQGHYWQGRQNDDRAAEVWNKLLLISPGNPQALDGLARVALNQKRLAEAKKYLQQLKASYPNDPATALLEQDVGLHEASKAALLNQARQFAAAGQFDQAAATYRKIFAGRAPLGALGREYYMYLGYTDGGLPEAIAGLQRLAAQHPDDAQIKLILGRHLARNEATRVQGIQQLAALSGRSDVGSQATESWRDALIWMGPPGPQYRAVFEQYLAKHPDDTEIRDQLAQGGKVQAQSQARERAQAQAQDRAQAQAQARAAAAAARASALSSQVAQAAKLVDQGELAQAEAQLKAILDRNPNDNQALGAMGILRMRQGEWTQARQYLQRARRGGKAWQGALDAADYWADIERAGSLQQAGKLAEAQQVLEKAAKRQPRETAATVKLADILFEQGKTEAARAAYQRVLGQHPDDPGALAGMAQVARASGDVRAARQSLEDALAKNPDDPWLRYQLAQIYQDAGRDKDARKLVDGLLAIHPDDPQALYASAMLAQQQGRLDAAREALARIPQGRRTAPMRAFAADLERNALVQQAGQLARQGRKAEAVALLDRVRGQTRPDDVQTLGALARGYADVGELGRGLDLLRPLRDQGGSRGMDATLIYAELLLRSDQTIEAGAILRQAARQPLSGAQRQALEDLSDSYRIHEADSLRESGDLVAAYDMIAPVLKRKPKDPVAVGALARMYAAAGKGDQALELYENLLQTDPDNAALHLGTAQVAQQLRNERRAAREAGIAVSLAPNDIAILTSAARVYRAQGKTSEAQDLLEKAVALESSRPVAVAAAPGSETLVRSDNPFVGLPGQRMAPVRPVAVPLAQETLAADLPPADASLPGAPAEVLAVDVPAAPALPGAAGEYPAGAAARQAALPPASPAPAYAAPVPAYAAAAAPADPAPAFAGGAAAARSANPFDTAASARGMTAAARELDEVRQERSPEIRAGVEFRNREGDSGTSQLVEAQTPIEVRMPAGNGKIAVQVTPTVISTGSLGSAGYALGTFGGGPLSMVASSAVPDTGRQTGVGLALGYETRGMKFDAGVTPLGFKEQNFVGGALFDGVLDDAGTVTYRLDVSRRAVTDSVLSFAGMEDSRLGLKWGGVTASGARFTLSKDFGGGGIYGNAAWHSLRGHNVASNQRKEFNLGTYFRLIDEPDAQLLAGLNLNATFYDKDLSYFTYGHGGYFSPKHYYSVGLPITWAQRNGPLSWRIDGSVGVQRIKQGDAPLFPNDGGMQNAALAAIAALERPELSGVSGGYYPGSSKTGVGYNLSAAAEYRMAPQWVLGARLGADNASDYRQWSGGLYLRYFFYPQSGLMSLPVEPYRSPFSQAYGR